MFPPIFIDGTVNRVRTNKSNAIILALLLCIRLLIVCQSIKHDDFPREKRASGSIGAQTIGIHTSILL